MITDMSKQHARPDGGRKELYTRFVSSYLFPLHEALKGHATTRLLRELEQSQWLNPSDIFAIQSQKLVRFLSDISLHVPYYRELFDKSHIDITAILSAKDLYRIPLLTKEIIRTNTDSLASEKYRGLTLKKTGGSTGQPLEFFVGDDRVSHDVAARWRALRWWGVDVGDRELVLWGAPAELGAQDTIRLIRDRLFRSRLVSAFDLSKPNMLSLIGTIRKYKPIVVFGYPSTLAYFSRFLLDRGFSLADCGVKVVFVTSEVLYADQREVIESAFGCPVANEYGGRESGFIARECPEGRMHISSEDIIVELVDENGRPVQLGESGEVVITHLATAGFPFLRYKTGDIATLDEEPCPCGRGLPVLKEVIGRSNDLLITQSGAVVHPNAINYIVREFHKIVAYKVIQTSLSQLKILLEVNGNLTAKEESDFRGMFVEKLGNGISINIEVVEKIPAEKSGKHRFVISHCQPGNSS